MIYILEFGAPLGNLSTPHGSARYYIGWCEDWRLEERFNEHRNGLGAAITRAAVERGISLSIVVTMPGNRKDERRLKNQKNTPRIVKQHKEKTNDHPNSSSQF